jgi:hypothetical protein
MNISMCIYLGEKQKRQPDVYEYMNIDKLPQ